MSLSNVQGHQLHDGHRRQGDDTVAMRIILASLLVTVAAIAGEVQIKTIDYLHGEVALRGALALPATTGPVPGVLVVPEWWGQNAYAQRRAKELAEHGYAAFACDMYGAGEVTEDPKRAGALAGPFYQNRPLMVARARAGLAQLAKAPGVDAKRLSAIGFCFGGTVVLELARAGEPLQLVASFHGGLKTTTAVQPGSILAKILVLHGGSDTLVPPDELAGFMNEMLSAKAQWNMAVYGSAQHAFTNPKAAQFKGQLPVDYDAPAEVAAMARLYEALAVSTR